MDAVVAPSCRTCLLLIDLQRDFFTDDGFMHLPHEALARNVARAVAHARALNWLVVWVRSQYTAQADQQPVFIALPEEWMPSVPRNDRYHSGTHAGPKLCCKAGTRVSCR